MDSRDHRILIPSGEHQHTSRRALEAQKSKTYQDASRFRGEGPRNIPKKFRLTSSLRSCRSLVVGTPTLKEGIGYRGSKGAIATAGQGALVSEDERRPIPRRPLFYGHSFYFWPGGGHNTQQALFDF